jgi:hypothetical protein
LEIAIVVWKSDTNKPEYGQPPTFTVEAVNVPAVGDVLELPHDNAHALNTVIERRFIFSKGADARELSIQEAWLLVRPTT